MSPGPQVTFTSDFFKPIAGALGAEQLRERGVPVEGVIPEDLGWVVMISRKPFMLWLACSNTDGSTTEWTVYPVAECRCSSASSTVLTLRPRSND